jgi:methyl-accepting chemotaxis protein
MNLLSKINIGKRLIISFSTLWVFIIVIIAVTVSGLLDVNKQVNLNARNSEQLSITQDVSAYAHKIGELIAVITITNEKNQRELLKSKIAKIRPVYLSLLDSLKELIDNEEEQVVLKALVEAVTNAQISSNEAIKLADSGLQDEARTLFSEKALIELENISDNSEKMVDFQKKEILKHESKVKKTAVSLTRLILVIGALLIVFSIFMSILTTGSITKPLAEISRNIVAVADGNISSDLPQGLLARPDEVGNMGKCVQSLISNLKNIVTDLTSGVMDISTSTGELKSIASALNEETVGLKQRATTIAASTEEMSANTRSVASGMSETSAASPLLLLQQKDECYHF